ncbi:MAG: pyridoxamine 5'-phosphate oxidase family protein [Ilumatobacteraceae bacterium]
MSSFYGEQQRVLQDQFDSRGIADVLEAVIVQPEINDESAAFIESRSFFFLSTVDAHGHPTVSHTGGAAGFDHYAGADLIVRAVVSEVFVNCHHYITPHTPAAVSKYVPDANGDAPLPGWKKIDALQPFLPTRFQGIAETENDLITTDEYQRRLAIGEGRVSCTNVAGHALFALSMGDCAHRHLSVRAEPCELSRVRGADRYRRRPLVGLLSDALPASGAKRRRAFTGSCGRGSTRRPNRGGTHRSDRPRRMPGLGPLPWRPAARLTSPGSHHHTPRRTLRAVRSIRSSHAVAISSASAAT